MKRSLCLFLTIVCIICLWGCKDEKAEIKQPVNYYYRTVPTQYGSDATIITCEVREAYGYGNDYRLLIEQYLNGPKTYDCISPFPAGTTLEEFSLSSNKAEIMLSTHMSILSGSELMLACACLTRTVCEMTGVGAVEISSDGGMLNNEESITLTADSFSYLDLG